MNWKIGTETKFHMENPKITEFLRTTKCIKYLSIYLSQTCINIHRKRKIIMFYNVPANTIMAGEFKQRLVNTTMADEFRTAHQHKHKCKNRLLV